MKEGVNVGVLVRVGVLDNAAIAAWACRVCAARVARALRFSVAEGVGVRVAVCGSGVRVEVGEFASVDVSCAAKEAVTAWVSRKVGTEVAVRTRSGVAVRSPRFARKGVFVGVGSPPGDRVMAGVPA